LNEEHKKRERSERRPQDAPQVGVKIVYLRERYIFRDREPQANGGAAAASKSWNVSRRFPLHHLQGLQVITLTP
jgi:hypothetical protein